MTSFDEQREDLFNLLLDNPDYQIILNEPTENFLKMLQKTHRLKCSTCDLQLQSKMIVYSQTCMYCVGCFAKTANGNESYLTVDLGKKMIDHRNWTIHEELQIINLISIFGIENCREVAKNQTTQKSVQTIQTYQNSIFHQKPQKGRSKLRAQVREEEKEKIYEDFFETLYKNNYQVLDYMLAELHQHSDPNIQSFLLENKRAQDQQMAKIHAKIEALAKKYQERSASAEQYESQAESMVISEFESEKESFNFSNIRSRTNKLLQESDEFIENKKRKDKLKLKQERGPTQSEKEVARDKKSLKIKKITRSHHKQDSEHN